MQIEHRFVPNKVLNQPSLSLEWTINGVGPLKSAEAFILARAITIPRVVEVLRTLFSNPHTDFAGCAAALEAILVAKVAERQRLNDLEREERKEWDQRWETTEEKGEDVVNLRPAMDPDYEVVPPKKIGQGARRAHVRQFLAELKARHYTRKEAISPMLKYNLNHCEPPLTTGELQGPLDATWPPLEEQRETKRGA